MYLNSNQISIINQIKNFVVSTGIESLISNPVPGEEFIQSNLNYFQNNFTPEELFLIVECPYYCDDFSIRNAKKYLDELEDLDVALEGTDTKCSCRYTIYCLTHNDPLHPKICQDTGCGTIAECGLMGTSHCTGNCR